MHGASHSNTTPPKWRWARQQPMHSARLEQFLLLVVLLIACLANAPLGHAQAWVGPHCLGSEAGVAITCEWSLQSQAPASGTTTSSVPSTSTTPTTTTAATTTTTTTTTANSTLTVAATGTSTSAAQPNMTTTADVTADVSNATLAAARFAFAADDTGDNNNSTIGGNNSTTVATTFYVPNSTSVTPSNSTTATTASSSTTSTATSTATVISTTTITPTTSPSWCIAGGAAVVYLPVSTISLTYVVNSTSGAQLVFTSLTVPVTTTGTVTTATTAASTTITAATAGSSSTTLAETTVNGTLNGTSGEPSNTTLWFSTNVSSNSTENASSTAVSNNTTTVAAATVSSTTGATTTTTPMATTAPVQYDTPPLWSAAVLASLFGVDTCAVANGTANVASADTAGSFLLDEAAVDPVASLTVGSCGAPDSVDMSVSGMLAIQPSRWACGGSGTALMCPVAAPYVIGFCVTESGCRSASCGACSDTDTVAVLCGQLATTSAAYTVNAYQASWRYTANANITFVSVNVTANASSATMTASPTSTVGAATSTEALTTTTTSVSNATAANESHANATAIITNATASENASTFAATSTTVSHVTAVGGNNSTTSVNVSTTAATGSTAGGNNSSSSGNETNSSTTSSAAAFTTISAATSSPSDDGTSSELVMLVTERVACQADEVPIGLCATVPGRVSSTATTTAGASAVAAVVGNPLCVGNVAYVSVLCSALALPTTTTTSTTTVFTNASTSTSASNATTTTSRRPTTTTTSTTTVTPTSTTAPPVTTAAPPPIDPAYSAPPLTTANVAAWLPADTVTLSDAVHGAAAEFELLLLPIWENVTNATNASTMNASLMVAAAAVGWDPATFLAYPRWNPYPALAASIFAAVATNSADWAAAWAVDLRRAVMRATLPASLMDFVPPSVADAESATTDFIGSDVSTTYPPPSLFGIGARLSFLMSGISGSAGLGAGEFFVTPVDADVTSTEVAVSSAVAQALGAVSTTQLALSTSLSAPADPRKVMRISLAADPCYAPAFDYDVAPLVIAGDSVVPYLDGMQGDYLASLTGAAYVGTDSVSGRVLSSNVTVNATTMWAASTTATSTSAASARNPRMPPVLRVNTASYDPSSDSSRFAYGGWRGRVGQVVLIVTFGIAVMQAALGNYHACVETIWAIQGIVLAANGEWATTDDPDRSGASSSGPLMGILHSASPCTRPVLLTYTRHVFWLLRVSPAAVTSWTPMIAQVAVIVATPTCFALLSRFARRVPSLRLLYPCVPLLLVGVFYLGGIQSGLTHFLLGLTLEPNSALGWQRWFGIGFAAAVFVGFAILVRVSVGGATEGMELAEVYFQSKKGKPVFPGDEQKPNFWASTVWVPASLRYRNAPVIGIYGSSTATLGTAERAPVVHRMKGDVATASSLADSKGSNMPKATASLIPFYVSLLVVTATCALMCADPGTLDTIHCTALVAAALGLHGVSGVIHLACAKLICRSSAWGVALSLLHFGRAAFLGAVFAGTRCDGGQDAAAQQTTMDVLAVLGLCLVFVGALVGVRTSLIERRIALNRGGGIRGAGNSGGGLGGDGSSMAAPLVVPAGGATPDDAEELDAEDETMLRDLENIGQEFMDLGHAIGSTAGFASAAAAFVFSGLESAASVPLGLRLQKGALPPAGTGTGEQAAPPHKKLQPRTYAGPRVPTPPPVPIAESVESEEAAATPVQALIVPTVAPVVNLPAPEKTPQQLPPKPYRNLSQLQGTLAPYSDPRDAFLPRRNEADGSLVTGSVASHPSTAPTPSLVVAAHASAARADTKAANTGGIKFTAAEDFDNLDAFLSPRELRRAAVSLFDPNNQTSLGADVERSRASTAPAKGAAGSSAPDPLAGVPISVRRAVSGHAMNIVKASLPGAPPPAFVPTNLHYADPAEQWL